MSTEDERAAVRRDVADARATVDHMTLSLADDCGGSGYASWMGRRSGREYEYECPTCHGSGGAAQSSGLPTKEGETP